MLSQKDKPGEKRDPSRTGKRCSIMLLDSQPDLADQLKGILGDSSVLVATTTHWKPALELSITGKIDLIICDLELPDDGAKQLFHELKSNHPERLSSLLFSRNIFTRPNADFLTSGEKRELLDRPFKNDQALKIVTRRLTRLRNRDASY